jgi:hypothetical protein
MGLVLKEIAMTRIVIDDVLKEQLQGLTAPAVLTDRDGRELVRVMPLDPTSYVGREPRISDAERQQRRNHTGPMRTTDEVMKRLEGM